MKIEPQADDNRDCVEEVEDAEMSFAGLGLSGTERCADVPSLGKSFKAKFVELYGRVEDRIEELKISSNDCTNGSQSCVYCLGGEHVNQLYDARKVA